MAGGRILEAHARVETGAAALRPGDAATLVLSVTHDGEGTPAWPTKEELTTALGGKAVVLGDARLGPATSADPPGMPPASGTRVEASWDVRVLLAPGESELGPFAMRLVDAQDAELDAIEIPAATVTVVSSLDDVMAERLDEASGSEDPAALQGLVAEQLAPVRGPWRLDGRLPWSALAGGVTGAFGLLLLGLWIWRRLSRRPAKVIPPPPPAPLGEEARRRLLALPEFLDRGEHLLFHVELADILKGHASRCLDADLLEKTTSEVRSILRDLQRRRPDWFRRREELQSILSACDLVKFARDLPPRKDSLSLVERVSSIVEESTAQQLEAARLLEEAAKSARKSTPAVREEGAA
jgi:hypothetical protein